MRTLIIVTICQYRSFAGFHSFPRSSNLLFFRSSHCFQENTKKRQIWKYMGSVIQSKRYKIWSKIFQNRCGLPLECHPEIRSSKAVVSSDSLQFFVGRQRSHRSSLGNPCQIAGQSSHSPISAPTPTSVASNLRPERRAPSRYISANAKKCIWYRELGLNWRTRSIWCLVGFCSFFCWVKKSKTRARWRGRHSGRGRM